MRSSCFFVKCSRQLLSHSSSSRNRHLNSHIYKRNRIKGPYYSCCMSAGRAAVCFSTAASSCRFLWEPCPPRRGQNKQVYAKFFKPLLISSAKLANATSHDKNVEFVKERIKIGWLNNVSVAQNSFIFRNVLNFQ